MFLHRSACAGLAVYGWLAAAAWALNVDAPLQDPAQEARAKALFHDIRCVVCQSEAIADSPAAIATDMRQAIRERIRDGDSDEAVKRYLVARYGNVILMKPPLTPVTWPLWFGPLFLLGIAAAFAWRQCFSPSKRRRQRP